MRRAEEPDPRSTLTLLSEARAGDERAAEELFERHRMLLRRWGRGRLPGAARGLVDTEDLVQDVLFRTLHHLGSFEPEHKGAFRAYLRRSFLRLILDHRRRIHRKPPPEATPGEIPAAGSSPEDEALEKDRLDRYEGALARLRAADREAIIARLELGMSYRDIARELGKPSPDAARKSVAQAVKRLAEQMASDLER